MGAHNGHIGIHKKEITALSAFIVNKEEIDQMVTAGIAAELVAPVEADEIGRILWRENLRSLGYRYPDCAERDDWPGPARFRAADVESYRWEETEVLRGRELVEVVKSYDYQACEHPEYESSEAFRWVGRLLWAADHSLEREVA